MAALMLTNFPNSDQYDLTLNSVYKDYPKQCFPVKLNKTSGTKTKELKFEHIDDDLYDQQANMAAFRVPVNKIVPYIRGLSILYYEIYGEMDKYTVNWYDDSLCWSKKPGGKKSICIDISKSDIPLLYKITYHIGTGIIQVQGNYKDQFVNIDFPKLKAIVAKVIEFNNLVSQNDTESEIVSDNSSTTSELNDTVVDNSSVDNDVKSYDETSPKTLEDSNINYTENDSNNNKTIKPTVMDSSCNVMTTDSSSQTSNSTIMPFSDIDTGTTLTLINRLESNFKSSLEKICTQQTAMMSAKVELIQSLFTQSIQSSDAKFSQMFDKFNTITNKWIDVEKDNTELKTKLQNTTHTTTLEKEIIKSNLESKCSILKQQNDIQKDRLNKLNSKIESLAAELNQKSTEINNLQCASSQLSAKLHDKESEIMGLKMHNSRDDSGEFQEVKPRHPTHSTKPHVTIIGTSNINGIQPDKLSYSFSANKISAYTLQQTEEEVKHLKNTPTLLVLHSLTNDLKSKSPSDCVDKMCDIVNDIHELYPKTKIIISLPTPRNDSDDFNIKGQLISVMIKDKLRGNTMVSFCDNSNMCYKGEALSRYLSHQDGYHLSPNGISILASNIRDSIDEALNLPKRIPRREHRQYPRRGRGYNNNYNRGGGRGGSGRGFNYRP